MLILKNARLIPELTEGYEEKSADVVIEDGKITEIVPAGLARFGESDEVIDLDGKTLMPGLIEAHLHLDLCGMDTFEENVQPDGYRVMRALKLAQDNLKMGYTTVRDLGDRNNITLGLSQAVKDGLVTGPDILTSGMIISPTEMGNDYFGSMYVEADSPEEYIKCVRKQYQMGADWIKIMASGAIMNPGATPGIPIIFERELEAACEAADYVKRPVAVHCHGTDAIKMCIRCGVRTVEHSTLMDDEVIEMYLKSGKTFPIPTFSPVIDFIEHANKRPKHYVEKTLKITDQYFEGMNKLRKSGVKIGWGTDAGVYEGSHGNGLYESIARVKYAGFTPLECLIQATKNNAEILMIDDTVGTIKVGKKANLVVFSGNPDEYIEALANVDIVIKDGNVINLA